jgi:Reverse transcriptase (RNA-dependent DNA polymerase)
MDSAAVTSYRPISSLPVLSKLLEHFIISQLVRYLKDSALLLDLQSVCRAYRSTETAMLRILADTLMALGTGNLAAVVLLDLSAAFDTVNHLTPADADIIQAARCLGQLACLIPERSPAACPQPDVEVCTTIDWMWRPSRVGFRTDRFSHVRYGLNSAR